MHELETRRFSSALARSSRVGQPKDLSLALASCTRDPQPSTHQPLTVYDRKSSLRTMAGRILPIALAAVAGVSIGIATFDGEFKEQRRKRLEEEYQRYMFHSPACVTFTDRNSDLAAVSSLNNEGPSPMSSSALPSQQPLPAAPTESQTESKTSRLSSMLGLWAWKKDNHSEQESSAAKNTQAARGENIEEGKRQP